MPPHSDRLGDDVRTEARRAIEAIVLVCEEPLAPHLLAQLLELSPVIVEQLCHELAAEYETEGRGFQLVRVAGGWRYQTHPDQAAYVERFVLEGQTAKLSAAALETLAIVAYKQPISRAQVAAIRGVSVDGVMRTLAQRGYIAEVGRDPGPGQATLFGTTRAFLEQLGLDSLDDLPALGEFVPHAEIVEQLEEGLRPSASAHEQLLDAGATAAGNPPTVGEVERFLATSLGDDPPDEALGEDAAGGGGADADVPEDGRANGSRGDDPGDGAGSGHVD
jgi:segregation and condensation protein B